MNESNNQTGSLNVQTDATSIYEGGNLLPVSIKDVKGNEVAIRQLMNSLNLAHKEHSESQKTIEHLKIEVASLSLQPLVALILSVTNIAGAILIGFGTNYLSSTTPPASASWILGIGIVLTAIGAIIPPTLPIILKALRGK